MIGKDKKSSEKLAALFTPTRMVCGVYDFAGAEQEEQTLATVHSIRVALSKIKK